MSRKKEQSPVFVKRGDQIVRVAVAGRSVVIPGVAVVEAVPQLAYEYVARVAIVDGRPNLSEVVVRQREGGPQITARRVQAELGGVRRTAISSLSAPIAEDGTIAVDQGGDLGEIEVLMSGSDRGRPRITLAELRQAARAYRAAQKAGRSTTAAVASALQVTAGVARRRVMAARHAGYLPPTGGTTRPRRS